MKLKRVKIKEGKVGALQWVSPSISNNSSKLSSNTSLKWCSGQMRAPLHTDSLTDWLMLDCWLIWGNDVPIWQKNYQLRITTHTQRRLTVTADGFLTSNELISDGAAGRSSDCHLCVTVIKQQQVRGCDWISIVLLLVVVLLSAFIQWKEVDCAACVYLCVLCKYLGIWFTVRQLYLDVSWHAAFSIRHISFLIVTRQYLWILHTSKREDKLKACLPVSSS